MLCVVSAIALAAGCGSDRTTASPAPAAPGETSVPSASAVPGETSVPSASAVPGETSVPKVLQFTAPLVGGGELRAATLAGRPVALWFWAPT
ncbi:unannotated protein [freshwater metagenome]|uniref:Unannotated protein n=1 Tax=freshwater metagenome TaxID=449393 RepID=A0A6J7AVM0_9ZZZZ